MKLNEIAKITGKKAKRIGRGESSGKGKTSGRGMKGQKARGKLPLSFEGGQLPIIKRLPFQRGVGNSKAGKKVVVSLSKLEVFASGARIDAQALIEKNLLTRADLKKKIKVVAGKIDKPLEVLLPVTSEAKKAIEKAKGKVGNV